MDDATEMVVVGAATSAGAHRAGQERAPAALRAAGLVGRLRAGVLPVADVGDVVQETFWADRGNPDARNVEATCRAAARSARRSRRSPRAGPARW